MSILDSISSAVSDVVDLAGDIASGDIGGALDNVADLAQTAAPFVSMVNPVAGLALGAGASILDKAAGAVPGGGQGGGLLDFVLKGQIDDVANDKIFEAKKLANAAANGGGGSILEQLAVIMGTAVKSQADDIITLAEKIGNKESENNFADAFRLQGMAQELGAMSKAGTEAISSIGQAATTAVSK